MADNKKSALYWAPRILGILSMLFLAVFALDVFGEGYRFGELLVALFMHLIPSFVLLVTLIVAWRKERWGGGLYIFLGILYIWMFWDQGDWASYLIIAGPLFLTGILFLLNDWITRSQASTENDQQEP